VRDRLALARWIARAAKIGTAVLVGAGLVLSAAFIAWPQLFSPGAGRLRPGPGGVLAGEAEGWVHSAEPSTSTVRVSSGFLGLSSISLLITPDTVILVGGKEGGVDDMYEGRWVRAVYEERAGGLRARRVEVAVGGTRAEVGQAAGRPEPPQPATRAVGTEPATPLRERPEQGIRSAAETPRGPAAEPSGESARTPALSPGVIREGPSRDPAPPPPPVPKAPRRRPDPRPEPQAPAAAARRPVEREPRPESRRPTASPPDVREEPAPRPRDAESRQAQETDPGAVIDWLLQQRSPPRGP
jgi:hypothetical protein